MEPGTVRAVLDANVLYSAFLRDVLLRLAAAGLYLPYWSDRIHDEWVRNLLAHGPDLVPANLARTRAGMDTYFPGALVAGHEPLEDRFGGVAPEDRHVAATALGAGAGLIVTQNLRDFPLSALSPNGIAVTSPDQFIQMLIARDADAVRSALEDHRRGLKRPPLEPDAYRLTFIRNGLSGSAALLWP
jgi:hypothetical protein